MFNKIKNLRKRHQLLFSLIVLSGLVCLWRGVWGLLDIYLMPQNQPLSFLLSILLGVIIISITRYAIDKLV